MGKVLVACEESQIVTKAFIDAGHDAMSCDIAYDGALGMPHYKGDVRDLLTEYYDLVIFHPVCRYIANSGVQWLRRELDRWHNLKDACSFFNLRHKFNSTRVATENPIPHGYAVEGRVKYKKDIDGVWIHTYSNIAHEHIGKPDQIIQPWQFGHEKMKATCFWLKGLPPLQPTKIVGPPPKNKKERYKWQDVWTASPGPERERLRSRTYQGIANAMADQWGKLL